MLLLASCSNQGTVLAKVGTQEITTDDFADAAKGAAAQYPGKPDSAKAALLDDLVKREILVQGAGRDTIQPQGIRDLSPAQEHEMLRRRCRKR
jgi:hypothetical protein